MRKYFTILIILLLSYNSYSQEEGMPIIKNFTSDVYEGGSRIYSIVCTKDGLLYAGDKSGMLEFDGENWSRIECGFAVTSLAVDSNDVVYVAGSRGIGKLALDSTYTITYESLNHFITTERNLKKFRFSKVFNIQDRIIYVLGKEIVINTAENIRIIESPYNFIYYQKLNDELYFYSPDDGIYQLVNNKLKLISDNDFIKRRSIVGFIYINDQLNVLIEQLGIYNLDLNTIVSASKLMAELNLTKILGIEQIDDSTYALKTYYNGVLLFNSKGDILKKYHYDEGLVNNTVFSVFKDYWENLWIGTASGISTIRLNFPFSKYNDPHGIGTGYASLFYKDKYYFATSQGLYSSEKNEQGHLKFTNIFSGHVWGLHIINDILYFGSPSGIYSWDNKRVDQTSYYPGGWNLLNIPENKDYYLTGTPAGILLLKNSKNNLIKHERVFEEVKGNIKKIEIDRNRNFWAEYEGGIYRFNLNDDLSEIINIRSIDRIEVNNKIKRLLRFKDELYFLADSGIYLHNDSDGFYLDTAFKTLYKHGNIPSNIIIDDINRWWMFNDGKLSCYAFVNDTFKKLNYNFSDFANDTYPIDYENVFSVDSHYVIIGQEEGFLGYTVTKNYNGLYSANRIRKIIVTSKNGKQSILKGSEKIVDWTQYGKYEKGIKNSSSIKFYYSAGCSKHNSVKYSTFLQGFDSQWPDWSKETVKEYTNLPKGDYKFIVRSINKSNEESTIAIYDFTVLSPWYFTIVAKIIYLFIAIFLVIIIERLIQLRTKRVRKKLQKEQEEILYRQEQDQIQENLKKQQEIIKLKNEKLRIDNLYKSKELANSTMGVIKKNQFLTELKEELEKIKEYSEKNKLVTGDVKDVIRKINRDIDNEENWKVFEDYFDRVHEKFLNRLKAKYPILSSKDLRLCAYLRMNLSTKEIAPLMNISVRGVEISRYRLRRKLEIDRNDNLNDFLMKF